MKKGGCLGIFMATVCLSAPAVSLGGTANVESLGERGGIEYLRAKLPNAVTQAGGTITCDTGDEVTGGGGAIGGKGDVSHLNTSSPPNLSDDAWIAEGRTSSAGGKTVSTWAMCGPGATFIQQSTDTQPDYNAGFTCTPGTGVALSGGIQGTAGDILLRGFFPEPDPFDWIDSWQEATGASGTAETSMICSDAYAVQRRDETAKVAAGKAGKVVAECRKSQVVVGGGVQVRRNNIIQSDVWTLATQPWDSKKMGTDPGGRLASKVL